MTNKSKKSYLLWWLLLAAMVCLSALAVGALLLAKPIIKYLAISRAESQGYVLRSEDFDWSLQSVSFRNATVRLIDVADLTVELPELQVDLSGTKPQRILLTRPKASITGSPAVVAARMSQWSQRFASSYGLPVQAQGVSLTWRATPLSTPWLVISGATLQRRTDGGVLDAGDVTVSGRQVGRLQAAWSAKMDLVKLGFGSRAIDDSNIRVTIEPRRDTPRVTIDFAPRPLADYAAPFGVVIARSAATIGGRVQFNYDMGDGSRGLEGDISLELSNYVPPHPPELAAFIHGQQTRISSQLHVLADYSRVDLKNIVVAIGALALNGQGTIERRVDHARVRMQLQGKLACAALAAAAAKQHLGQLLGGLTGNAAKQFVGGAVSVNLHIDADSRALGSATVKKRVGVGCGLKQMKLNGLKDFPKLPIDLSKLPDLKLPSAFPPIKPPDWSGSSKRPMSDQSTSDAAK